MKKRTFHHQIDVSTVPRSYATSLTPKSQTCAIDSITFAASFHDKMRKINFLNRNLIEVISNWANFLRR